jgi:hypothetical protein
MTSDQPSRRQLLGGLLASWFGWLFAGPADAARRQPEPVAPTKDRPEGMVTVTAYTGDAPGWPLGVPPAYGPGTLGTVTTYASSG